MDQQSVEQVNIGNFQDVSYHPSAGRVFVTAPYTRMTADEALVHAAWLVLAADRDGERFAAILERVRSAEQGQP